MSAYHRKRPIQDADHDFLLGLYRSTRQFEMSQVDWPEQTKERFVRGQFEAQARHYRAAFPRASYDLLLSAEEPVGRLYLWKSQAELRLLDITIQEERRGLGIGSYWMEELLAEAEKLAQSITLHVYQQNSRAHRFYQRLGFTSQGAEGPYILMQRKFWESG